MSSQNKKQKTVPFPSEIRQDIVTGDWVIIATGRGKRPHDFVSETEELLSDSLSECPFEDPIASGQEKDILLYTTHDGDWSLRVFPNKYPALTRGRVPRLIGEGPYTGFTGAGYHELVVTRDHKRHIALLDAPRIAEIFDAYQDRYIDLMRRRSVKYIGIIHNHGKRAGASLSHPHSQIFALPVVSPYIQLELDGANRYRKSNRKCVYCEMIAYEREVKTRVIAENEKYIAFCPYASRVAFEVWIAPKKHNPYFERLPNEDKLPLAEVFGRVMASLYKGLNNPDYNFYIHTAPCDGQEYSSFHWHIEVLPQTAVWAGFELSTGIEISTIEPEKASQFLRGVMSDG